MYTTSSSVVIRTGHDTRRFANIADSTGTTMFGIKGENMLGGLVDIPDNLPIDWMHCVHEGIMKRLLFKQWLDPRCASRHYSLSGFTAELDDMFFFPIKVPHDSTRKLRSIK